MRRCLFAVGSFIDIFVSGASLLLEHPKFTTVDNFICHFAHLSVKIVVASYYKMGRLVRKYVSCVSCRAVSGAAKSFKKVVDEAGWVW